MLTHDIPAFYHVFVSFHIVISVVITLYLILSFLCTSSEKGSIWRLCGDLKKKNGEPSLNVTTLRLDDVPIFISPTSRRRRDLISEIFRYKEEMTNSNGRRTKKTTQA